MSFYKLLLMTSNYILIAFSGMHFLVNENLIEFLFVKCHNLDTSVNIFIKST